MESYLKHQMEKALMRAIKLFGSQKKLAKALGISRSRLNHYLTRKSVMPWVIAFAIERLTKAKEEGQTVSALQLAGYMNAEEKAAVILQALDAVKQGLLPLHEKPLLVDYLYHYKTQQRCVIPCLRIRGCTFAQALKRVGLSLKKYNQITLVNQQGIDELITAVNCREITITQASLIATLSVKEQQSLLSLEATERLAAIRALEAKSSEQPSKHPNLSPLDYLRLLQKEVDIQPLREELSLYSLVAISLAIEITLKNRQGQRSDLQKGAKKGQKEAVFDEVNSATARVGSHFEEILKNFDEVRAHVAAMRAVADDIMAYAANYKGRTDELIAQCMEFGNRQTYRQLKFIFLHQFELLTAVEAKEISIFNAYQQVKTKQYLSLINSHEEVSL